MLKSRKLQALQNSTNDESFGNTQVTHTPHKLVITIPAEMGLSEAETSVLSKGLSFVPVIKNTDEFQIKADCGNFFVAFG